MYTSITRYRLTHDTKEKAHLNKNKYKAIKSRIQLKYSNQLSLYLSARCFPIRKEHKDLYHQTRPWGYKTFFLLNSTEHEILTAHKN